MTELPKALVRQRTAIGPLAEFSLGGNSLHYDSDAKSRVLRAIKRRDEWLQRLSVFEAEGTFAPDDQSNPKFQRDAWAQAQREAYHRNSLADWQIDMLDEINFDWQEPTMVGKSTYARRLKTQVKCEPMSRLSVVLVRAVHAHVFPVERDQIAVPELGGVAIEEFFARAWFYEQAVRCRLLIGGEWSQAWWLTSARAQGDGGVPCVELEVARRRDTKAWNLEGGTVPLTISSLSKVQRMGYSENGGEYCLELSMESGTRVLLDYDVCLADQTHRGARFDLFKTAWRLAGSFPARINWHQWQDGPPVPQLASVRSTANVAFERSFAKLQAEIARLREMDSEASAPYISWAAHREHYKFIEHLVLKCRQGVVQPSHIERVSAAGFRYGNEADAIDVVLEYQRREPTGCVPFRSSAIYAHRGIAANEHFALEA